MMVLDPYIYALLSLIGSTSCLIVKGGFKLSFYGGLKMYDLGGLGIDRCQSI